MSPKYNKVAYSFVIADLFHYGHLKLLKTAKENADYHICGLISDEVCHLWQGKNICNYGERKGVLESLDCVDEVIKQESMDPTENLKTIKKKYPDSKLIVVHGDDWKTLPCKEYIESNGGEIIQPEYYAQLSRDNIISKFQHPISSHPLNHENFTHHFRIGDIIQFNSQAVSPLVSTKANTLKSFQPILKSSKIEKIFVCTVEDFQNYRDDIAESVQKQFNNEKLVIRSSSINEDLYEKSNAGCFDSINNVDSNNKKKITHSIQQVIQSYKKGGELNPKDQILIQSQTENIKKSGVVFTRNIQANTPYYLINYDDETGKTDTVTGGLAGKSVFLFRETKVSDYPSEWRGLMAAVQEIENYLPGMIIDIEFAEKTDGTIVVFQIRPLATNLRADKFNDDVLRETIESNIQKYCRNSEKINNSPAFLSDMAFWNPSEIIGDNPHPLDYSIYREIITSRAWNLGIKRLGYTPIKYELMEKYGNKPYINLDYSFYSLMPDSLSRKIKNKLNKFYKSRLKNELTAHDKIEFEIVFSCYDFETEDRFAELLDNDFSSKEVEEITNSLIKLTCFIIEGHQSRLKRDLYDLNILAAKRMDIVRKSKDCDPIKYIKCFLQLLKDIETYGTIQFSSIAREAFIAKSICKSLVKKNLFEESEMNNFLENISTVATEFDLDFKKYVANEIKKEQFLEKYGHLRAGTYDIRALRYNQMDICNISHRQNITPDTSINHRCKSMYKTSWKNILKKTVFSHIAPNDFIYFLKSSIQQREYFKFEFTKSLSLALEFLAKAGELLGFSRKEFSFLDVVAIKSHKFYTIPDELAEFWKEVIDKKREIHLKNSELILPTVIQDKKDFKSIYFEISRPNFITQRYVEGEIVDFENNASTGIEDKIILIEKADPGFDWIFTKNIKGLITKYGGAASHMAIRCTEFNIPAAIGCGEQIYTKISRWEKLKLDCKRKKIQPAFTSYH